MSKKLTKKNDNSNEHIELEQAMQELSRQTDALLAQQPAKKTPPKPTLPKRKVVPHTKGKSLDIVNHAASSPKKLTKKSEHELLAEHAGLSFNEKPGEDGQAKRAPVIKVSKPAAPEPSAAEDPDSVKPGLIQNHQGKRLEPVKPAEPAADIKVKANENPKSQTASTKKDLKDSTEELAKATGDKEASLEPDTRPAEKEARAVDKHTDQGKEKIHFSEPEKLSQSKEEPGDSKTVELDDEDVIKKPDPEKPTVFDTSEYHSELHDWSKLARPRRWPLVVALLALIVSGLAGYLIMTDSLPLF